MNLIPGRPLRHISPRRAAALLVIHTLFGFATPARPAPSTPVADTEEPAAGGTLAWVFADELDMIGDMRVDLPYSLDLGRSLYLSLNARTTIEKTESDLTFLVHDLDYNLDLGLRERSRRFVGVPVSLFVGQWGSERVDADGQPYVRYIGLGAESEGFRGLRPGLQWRLAAGPVLQEREVQADGIFRATVRLTLPPTEGLWSGLGLDVEVNGLIDGDRLRADWRVGPHREFMFAGRRWASLFLHYQESDNPLGLGSSGFLLGMDYGEGGDGSTPDISPPDVGGNIAMGGGGGRLAGRLKLRVLSPPFAERTRAVVVVDANILTAEDTGELYYLYHLGLERAADQHVVGAYFYHRSNHQLAEPNERGVTSINVLEAGLETAGWDQPGTRRAGGSWGVLDARARIGFLINSTFGENRRWHVRGGLRWSLPLGSWRWAPFLLAEGEAGDIERQFYALGFATAQNVELRLEYRSDDQYFGRDKTALLLTTNVGF